MQTDNEPERVTAIGAAKPAMSGQPHRDHYGRYTHAMPEETGEASARTVIRLVPVAYGAILGGLIGSIALGVSIGLAFATALDLKMGDKSLSRPLFKSMLLSGCPLMAAAARGLARGMSGMGVPVPAVLREIRCRAS